MVDVYRIAEEDERLAKRGRRRPQRGSRACVKRENPVRHREQIDHVMSAAVAHQNVGDIEGLRLYAGIIAFQLQRQCLPQPPGNDGIRGQQGFARVGSGPEVVVGPRKYRFLRERAGCQRR